MRLLSKLTSLEPPRLQIREESRLLGSVLFSLLVLSSCTVPNGLWNTSGSKQGSDVNQLSGNSSGGNNTVISNTRPAGMSPEGVASTGQESDINRETSPAIGPNDVISSSTLPILSTLPAQTSHSSETLGVFFPSEPNRAVGVERNGTVSLWNAKDGKSYRLLGLDGDLGDAVAFNPEKLLLAVVSGGAVKIYALASGGLVASLDRLKTRIASLVFQPSGNSLVIGGADGEVYRWRFVEEQSSTVKRDRDKFFERYFGHANVVSSVAYHPIGRIFFSGDWSGALNAWLPYDADAYGGKFDLNLFGPKAFSEASVRTRAARLSTSSIEHIAISNDGQSMLVGAQDGTLEWWQIRGFVLEAFLPAHKGLLYDLAFAPSGKKGATVGRDGKLRVWSLDESQLEGTAKTEYKLDKIKESDVSGAIKLGFLDEGTVALGDRTGRISFVKL